MKANKDINPKDNTKKKSKKNQEEEVVTDPCTRCGEHNCVEGAEFCEDCLVEMINTRVPIMGWIAGAASLVLAVVAIAASVFLVSPTILCVRAEKAVKEKSWNDAVYYYDQMDSTLSDFRNLINWQEGSPEPFLRRFFKLGAGTHAKMFEAYAKMYGPLTAVEKLEVNDNTPLTKTETAKPYWEQYKGIVRAFDALYNSNRAPEANTYDASIKFIGEIEQQEGVDKVYTSYQKYLMAAVYYDQSIEESLKWLEICDDYAKKSGMDYKWLYYSDYANILNVTGEHNKALALMDELISDNNNNFNAYTQKTDILIDNGMLEEAEDFVDGLVEDFGNYSETQEMQLRVARCKGEYDKVMVLGDTLMANYAATPETYRQMALMFVAQGDYKNAFTYMDNGFSAAYMLNEEESAGISLEKIKETCYICAKLYEKHGEPTDEEKLKIAEIYYMFPEDYKTTDDGEALINGEKTAREILTQGDYDLV